MIGLDFSIQKQKDPSKEKQPAKKPQEEDLEPEKNIKEVNEYPAPEQKPTVVFVFDASTSMTSSIPAMIEALEIFFKVIVKVMRKRLRQPKPSTPEEEEAFFRRVVDVHLVIFSEKAKILYSSKYPSKYTLSWRQVIGKLRAQSSTNYSAAFANALSLFSSATDDDPAEKSAIDSHDFSHLQGTGVMIILTDGDPTSGQIRTLSDIQQYRKQCFPPNITTHVLGLGSCYNALNVASMGDHFCHLDHPEAVHEAIAGICKDIYAFGYNARLVLEGISDAEWTACRPMYLIGNAEARTFNVGRLLKRKRFVAAVAFEAQDPSVFQRLQQCNVHFVLHFTDSVTGARFAYSLPQVVCPGMPLPFEGKMPAWDAGALRYAGEPEATFLPLSYQENYIHQVKSQLLASLLGDRSASLIAFENKVDTELKWCEEAPAGRDAIGEIRARINQLKSGHWEVASRFCAQSISSMRTQSVTMSTSGTSMPSSSVFRPDKFSRSSDMFKSADHFLSPRLPSQSRMPFHSESFFSMGTSSPSSSTQLLPRTPLTKAHRFESQDFFMSRSSNLSQSTTALHPDDDTSELQDDDSPTSHPI